MSSRRSVRGRVLRRGLTATVQAVRRASGGAPDPELEDELVTFALRLRSQVESLAGRWRPPSRIDVQPAAGIPGRGLWVIDRDARAAAAAASQVDGDDRLAGGDLLGGVERVILHLHGGAYCLGSPETHRSLAAAMSRAAEAAVLLPAYRLAPEHPFPAALDDVVAAYRWLTEDEGLDPSRVVVSGDSAGGGLAAALLVRLRDEGRALPAAYVGLSPWTDLAATGPSLVDLDGIDPWLSAELVLPAARAYAADVPLDHPLVSPLYADLRELPPMLLHVGTDEILLDDAARFVERAREAGVDASLGRFAGMWHVFQLVPGLPEARAALREIGGFVRRHTTYPSARANGPEILN